MAENQIQIQISAGTDELVKALQNADKAAVKFSGSVVSSVDKIGTAASKASGGIKDGFSSAFGSLTKGVAIGNLVSTSILGVAGAIGDFVSGSVAAAEEQENAINKLSQALRAAGDFSEEAVADFNNFASELQRTTKFADDATLNALALAKSFGATNDQAKNLVLAAANLSATFGGTLDQNVEKLGKTFDGTSGKLAKYIPELKSLTEEQLRAGKAADIINSRFGGAAANEINTYTGRMTLLKNAFGDLQEVIGESVTKSGFFQGAIQGVTGWVTRFTQSIQDARTASARNKEGFVETTETLGQLERRYQKLTDEVTKYQTTIDKAQTNKSLVNAGDVQIAQVRIKSLRKELDELNKQIEAGKKSVDQSKAVTPSGDVKPIKITTQKDKAEAQRVLADRQALQEQIKQQDAEFEAYQAEQRLKSTTLTEEQRALEYQKLLDFENQKIEAVRQAELAKAQLIQDAQLRQTTIDQINNKASIERQKAQLNTEYRQEQENLNRRKALQQGYLDATSNFLQAGLVLAQEGSREQKALQTALAITSTYSAANKALAEVPYPANIAAASSLVALGLANIAKINAVKFATGGIVPGNKFSGDKVPSLLNSSEMVLNKQQQAELFRQANGMGGGNNTNALLLELINEVKSQPIVVQANGREIARLVRDENKSGFGVV